MKKMKVLMALISCFSLTILLMPIYATATSSESSGDVVSVGTEDDLRTALENGKSVELTTDIKITELSNNSGTRPAGIAITGEGVITINGNGYTISSSDVRTIFEIYATGKELNVTFSDVTITNSCKYTSTSGAGRIIDTRTGGITLTLNGTNLSTTGNYNTQVLTIGGDYSEIMEVNVLNSTILASEDGYGIITYNPVNLTIDNSSISGYAALYMKGKSDSQGSAGSIVNIRNKSVLSSTNDSSDESSNFATIAFADSGINVTVDNSTVNAVSTGDSYQFAFGNYIYTEGDNFVTVTGNSVVTVDTKEEFAVTVNMTVTDGVSSNVEIDDTYLADDCILINDDGNYLVVKQHVITVKEPTNGTINVDKTKVIEGETVTITVKPNDGYELNAIKVIDGDDNEIKVVDGKFIMPNSEVTITAEIIKIAVDTEIPTIDTAEEVEEVEVGIKNSEIIEDILLDSLKTNKNLDDVVNTTSVKVEVEIAKIEEKSIDETISKAMKEKAGDATIATFFDITIAVKNKKVGTLIDTLDELTEEIELMVLLPEELKNTDNSVKRDYYIIRKHGDEMKILDATLSEDGKSLVFKSDKFSTYALAYTDTVVEINDNINDDINNDINNDIIENPATGNSVLLYIVLASLSIGGLVASGTYIYKKRLTN